MKMKLLPMAIGAILAAQIGATQAAEVQVYGKTNTSVNTYDNEYFGTNQKSNQQLNSNASRVGVKGDLNINEDLKAVYKLEYQLYLDDGSSDDINGNSTNSNTIRARNNYGGLSSKTWGQIVAGKNDTPFKLIQNSDLDRFNDLDQGDMQNYLVGEDRVNNMVMYSTPLLKGWTVNGQVYTNEQSGEDTTYGGYKTSTVPCATGSVPPQTASQTCGNNDDNNFEHYSTSVTYDIGTFYAGLAYNYNVGNTDAWRLMSSYKITDNFMVAGLIQTAEVHDNNYNQDIIDEGFGDGIRLNSGSLDSNLNAPGTTNDFNTAIDTQDAYMANIMWTIVPDQWVFYAQVGYSESTTFDSPAMANWKIGSTFYDFANAEFDSTFYGIGVDRILSKKVKLFGYATDQKVDIGNNPDVQAKLIDDGKWKTAGIGLEIKF